MTPSPGFASLAAPGLALVVSMVAAVATLVHAVRLDPITLQSPAPAPAAEGTLARPTSTPRDRVARTIETDPFRPERQRPPRPFRFPGEALAGDSTPNAGTPSAQAQVRLIGTAVLPQERGFAMCQVGDGPPRLVRPGERIGAYTLMRVARGRAVFRDAAGAAVEVQVPKAGS
jgi:hypothetical protein